MKTAQLLFEHTFLKPLDPFVCLSVCLIKEHFVNSSKFPCTNTLSRSIEPPQHRKCLNNRECVVSFQRFYICLPCS